MIYDLRVNIFTQLKVHRLERSTSLWLVHHKRYMLLHISSVDDWRPHSEHLHAASDAWA